MIQNKIFIIAFIFLASLVLVSAHSIYLFNISLDFDNSLRSNVIKSAQQFLDTKNEPIAFDLDKGLIMVHFEPEQRHYVEVSPLEYNVQGMRDENLKHTSGAKKMTKEQGYEIAEKLFEKLPDKVKSELRYGNVVSEADGTYFYKWFRYAGNILVAGEDFTVNVDAFNGNVIAWRISNFDYPKEAISTVSAISGSVAKRVAELSFNAPSVKDFEPYLIIVSNEPVWVDRLQGQFYPFFAGVNALDGSIAFNGLLPGEVPKNYSFGSEVKVVESEMIKQIYSAK